MEHAFYDASHRKDQFNIEKKWLNEELSKLKTHNAAEGRIIKKNTTFTSERENRKKGRENIEKENLQEIAEIEKQIKSLIDLRIKETFKMKDPQGLKRQLEKEVDRLKAEVDSAKIQVTGQISREKAKQSEIDRENTIVNETFDEIEKLKIESKTLEEKTNGKGLSDAEQKLKLLMAQQIMLE